MRSLNTDVGRVRYIVRKSETKKTRSQRRMKENDAVKMEEEAERFNELDGKGFLNSEGISNRAIPPAIRFLRREIQEFPTSLAGDRA